MTFDAIWDMLVRKRPALGKPDVMIAFTPDNLKALLRQVYDQGVKSASKDRADNAINELLGGIFGKKQL